MTVELNACRLKVLATVFDHLTRRDRLVRSNVEGQTTSLRSFKQTTHHSRNPFYGNDVATFITRHTKANWCMSITIFVRWNWRNHDRHQTQIKIQPMISVGVTRA